MVPVFWRGFGGMVFVLTAVSQVIAMALASLMGADISQNGKAYNGYGLLLASVATSAFYKFYLAPKRKQQLAAGGIQAKDTELWKYDSLMFIPFPAWIGLLFVGGIVLSIINLVTR